MPRQRRVLAHRNRRALTVHAAGVSTPRTCAPPRAALLAHPPAPIDDTPSGSLRLRAGSTSTPAALLPPEDGGLGLEQGRDRAASPPGRHTAHTRPGRRLSRRVFHDRRPRRDTSRRQRSALPDHSRTARHRLRRLARPPDQRRALRRPVRRQPHLPPTLHSHRAHQRGLRRGPRQRPHGRRVHLAVVCPRRPGTADASQELRRRDRCWKERCAGSHPGRGVIREHPLRGNAARS